MRVVRYSVQALPEVGFAVMELCPSFYARGECALSLLCSCTQSDGGPLCSVVKVCGTLGQALEAADVLEAAKGGARLLPSGGVRCSPVVWAAFHSIDEGEVPY